MRVYVRRNTVDKLDTMEYRTLSRLNYRQDGCMFDKLSTARRNKEPLVVFVARIKIADGLQKIVGWSMVAQSTSRALRHPVYFWVHGHYRRLGIGSMLFRKTQKYLDAHLWHMRVFPHTTASRAFFHKNMRK